MSGWTINKQATGKYKRRRENIHRLTRGILNNRSNTHSERQEMNAVHASEKVSKLLRRHRVGLVITTQPESPFPCLVVNFFYLLFFFFSSSSPKESGFKHRPTSILVRHVRSRCCCSPACSELCMPARNSSHCRGAQLRKMQMTVIHLLSFTFQDLLP